MREYLISKLTVLGNASMLRAHADMSLINLQVSWDAPNPSVLELVLWLIVLGIKEIRVVVLHYVASPGRITIHLSKIKQLSIKGRGDVILPILTLVPSGAVI